MFLDRIPPEDLTECYVHKTKDAFGLNTYKISGRRKVFDGSTAEQLTLVGD